MEDVNERVAVLETEVESLKVDLDGPRGVKATISDMATALSAAQLKLANLEWKIGLYIGITVVIGNKLLSAGLDALLKP